MFGKRPLFLKAVIVAQLLFLNTSLALASVDGDWLHMAKEADDLRRRGETKSSRNYWIKTLEKTDTEATTNPWTTIALRNITDLSLLIKDFDVAEKYSIQYVAELEKVDSEYPDLARALITRAKIFAIRKQFDRSTECLSRARKIAHDTPVDVTDYAEALTFLSANYEVLNDRKSSKRYEKELIEALLERRGTIAHQKLREAAFDLADFAQSLPEREKKCYVRVARSMCDQLFIESSRLGNMGFLASAVWLKMSQMSATLGEPERVYSELLKAKVECSKVDPNVNAEVRAAMLATISNVFSSTGHATEAAQCLNLARKFTGGKKYTSGWHLNRQAGELLIQSGDFKQAKAFYVEALTIAENPTQHCYSLIRLSDCAMRLGNSQESDRYLNMAFQEAVKVKQTASPETQENLTLLRQGFSQLTVSFQEKINPKAASRVHAFGLALLPEPKKKDVAGEYLWQGAIDIEARNIKDAEKNLNTYFSLAKYSINQPQITTKDPDNVSAPPDRERWSYTEYLRLSSLCAFYKHDTNTAIKLFQQYLAFGETLQWRRGASYCKFNAAMLFLQVGMLKDSRRLFKEVLEYTAKQKGVEEFNLSTSYWYAVALCEDGDYEESSRYCERVIELSKKSDIRESWLPMTYALQGRIQSLTGHHNEAQSLFDKAVASLTKKNSQDLANVLYWQLEDCLALKQNSKARELAKRAISLYEVKNCHTFTYENECRKLVSAI